MHLLNVRDTTAYRYSEPTGLGEHRSMFRPDDPLKEFAEHHPSGNAPEERPKADDRQGRADKGMSDATNV
jgi:hypothetical protein